MGENNMGLQDRDYYQEHIRRLQNRSYRDMPSYGRTSRSRTSFLTTIIQTVVYSLAVYGAVRLYVDVAKLRL
jgi:hypothetical protein